MLNHLLLDFREERVLILDKLLTAGALIQELLTKQTQLGLHFYLL